MYELALFAGAGGGLLDSQWIAGRRTVCYIEKEPYAVEVIKARIRDGALDDAPIWSNVRTFTKRNNQARPFIKQLKKIRRQLVITGGVPCTPVSPAGAHARTGWGDSRNLFPDTIRIVGEIRPAYVFLENSSDLLVSVGGDVPYIAIISAKLAQIGYDVQWGCLSAASVGADHIRERVWIIAHPRSQRRQQSKSPASMGKNEKWDIQAHRQEWQAKFHEVIASREITRAGGDWSGAPPRLCRMDDGLADRLDRIKAIGNGQHPDVAAAAWSIMTACSHNYGLQLTEDGN